MLSVIGSNEYAAGDRVWRRVGKLKKADIGKSGVSRPVSGQEYLLGVRFSASLFQMCSIRSA